MRAPVRSWGEDLASYAARVREYVECLNALDAPFQDMAQRRARRASQFPSANRGTGSFSDDAGPAFEHFSDEVPAIVDFFAATFPWSAMCEGYAGADSMRGCAVGAVTRARAAEGDESAQLAVAEWLLEAFAPGSGLLVDPTPRGFKSFYARHFQVRSPAGDFVGFVGMLGENTASTVLLELTGTGCAHVKAWAHSRAILDTLGGRITRVDLAHDDYEGRVSLDEARHWYDSGRFAQRGKTPAMQLVGWNDGSGRTLYVGKRESQKQLCVYEKGRQQGAREDDPFSRWVRWEVRLRGTRDVVLPSDVLTSPQTYMTGAFAPLRDVVRVAMTRLRTSAARAASNLAAAVRHIKRQAGALFHLVRTHLPRPDQVGEWVLRNVTRDKVPAWVRCNPLGDQTVSVAFST